MTASRYKKKLLLPVLIFIGMPWPGYTDTVISDNIHLSCEKTAVAERLSCDYRLVEPVIISNVNARVGDKALSLEDVADYPAQDSTTAILFIVDTSDPAREPVIRKNRRDLEVMLAAAAPHFQFGLARFDKGFRVLAPVGSSNRDLLQSVQTLHATGKITELYRSMLSAIDLLDRVDADRKSIYLMSDGLAEDKAYYHDDVVKAAKEAGIIITSLGYPRSISQSVGLQTIRRLSEETGGRYIEADNNHELPEEFTADPFATIDNGGSFMLDMPTLVSAGLETELLTLEIETAKGRYAAAIPLPVPDRPPPEQAVSNETATPAPATVEKPDTTQPVRVITRETAAQPFNKWFWYGIPIALIALLTLTIGMLLISNFRQNRKTPQKQSIGKFKPYAYLVLQDETKKRYAITRTTWRIGRGSDNEMILNDSSVSRRHAEIHRDKGDLFTIFDLDSLNGVYINNNKVSKTLLHEGDIIEIGDINLRFTLHSTDFSVEESTIMQNTRSPLTH